MKKIGFIVLACLTLPLQAAEVSLEGISILGTKRSAYVKLDGKDETVVAGDSLGGWTVERIEQRSLFLRDPNGNEQELMLHSRLSEVPATPVPPPADLNPADPATSQPPLATDNPFAQALREAAAGQAQPNPPGATPPPAFQPRLIQDSDVPPGHRKVSTPFGDVLVREQDSFSNIPAQPAE